MDLMVIEAPDMRSAEILDGTRLVGRCPDPNMARHLAHLIANAATREARDRESAEVLSDRRPKGANTVWAFEHGDGSTEVIVEVTTAVTCPDRDTAEVLRVLLEADDTKRERPVAWPYGAAGRAAREVAS